MKNDERFLKDWLDENAPDPVGARKDADQIMARLPETKQRSRRWPLLPSRRSSPRPSNDVHPPTINGRTRTMFSPDKAITAGALVFALGGALLVAQPLDRGETSAPGASVDAEPVPPVAFSARFASGPSVRDESWEGKTGSGGDRFTNGAWEWDVIEQASDPRLAGTVMIAWNHDEYAASLGDMNGPTVSHSTLRIENDQGAWQSLPTLYLDGGESSSLSWPVTLIGEGDFEGSYVVADLATLDADGWALDGLILTGEPLPAPEPLAAQ